MLRANSPKATAKCAPQMRRSYFPPILDTYICPGRHTVAPNSRSMQFRFDDGSPSTQCLELLKSDFARHVFHPTVRRRKEIFGCDIFESAADATCYLFGCFAHLIFDADDAED